MGVNFDTRTPISDALRAELVDAFAIVPEGRRGALVVLADAHGVRAAVAASIGGRWRVAAATSKPWDGPVTGSVMVVGSW